MIIGAFVSGILKIIFTGLAFVPIVGPFFGLLALILPW